MTETVLYDFEAKDHPFDKWFRTKQVFHCYVCEIFFNTAIHRVGKFGSGLRAECPNEHKKWHRELLEMINWLELHPHPKSYRTELQAEIDAVRKGAKSSLKIQNDVEGIPVPPVIVYKIINKPYKIS